MKMSSTMTLIVATAVLAGCTSAPNNNNTTAQPTQSQKPAEMQKPADTQKGTEAQKPAETQADTARTGAAVPPGAYPTETRTGIAAVDRAIEAVLKKDANTLISLVKMTPTACKTNTTIGDLPCSPGVANGTVIPAFAWSSSFAPQYTTERNFAEKFVVEKLTTHSMYLYAVSRSGSTVGPAYDIYMDDDPSDIYSRTIGVDRDGAIVSLHTSGKVTADQESWSRMDLVLPPRK